MPPTVEPPAAPVLAREAPATSSAGPSISLALAGDWHALYTRHQHEKAVALHLEQMGIQVFLPLYRAIHRWSDRRKQVVLPLFPCYVFFSGGLDRKLQILNTPGVCSLLSCGGKIAVIPTAELEAIQQAVNGLVCVQPHPFVHSGDRVRVRSGPLSGLEGIVVRVKDCTRIVLSVQTLCRSVAVEVDEAILQPIG